MKDGKNAADPITGQVMETQAGENFNVIGNTFIGKMKRDAIHIRSYHNVRHQHVFIAANQFEDASQSIHLENINGLTFKSGTNKIKIKSIDVKKISN